MAYGGGLLDILQGILGQQGQGYGQGSGQDQGNGLLAMMQQQQQGVPNQLATDETQGGTGLLAGGYGTGRLLGAGGAPAQFGTGGITGGGVNEAETVPASTAGAGAATATAAPLAPAAGGGGMFSGLSGAGASSLFSGLAGKAGGLSQWVQNNPGTIDALATGFANIGNKNVGNPFLYGANQAADELKEQVKGEAMKAALQKLGYPDAVAAAGGKIPAMGTLIVTNALKPKENTQKPEYITYTDANGREVKGWAYPGGNPAQVGAPKPAMSPDQQFGNVTGLRGEVQKLPSYKAYQTSIPLYNSMLKSLNTDSRASDLNFVYSLATIFDPTSVVREADAVMINKTGSLPSQIEGAINALNGGATLNEKTRRTLLAEAQSRISSYQESFDQDTQQYYEIAKRYGINPNDIIPRFKPLPGVPAAAVTPADALAEKERRRLRPPGGG